MATNINLNEGHFFVSVDGNRLKQHSENTVYLDNGREFQLEVFNPTTSKVLAKIKINGSYISSSGLVLKPGQRVFLERYFDIAKKFKYETYSVDNTPETAGAIANNGLIEIEFHKEQIPVQPILYNPPVWDWNWNNNNIYYSSGSGCYGSTPTIAGNINSFTCDASNMSFTDSSSVSNTSVSNNINVNASNYVGQSHSGELGRKADPSNHSGKLHKTTRDYNSLDFMPTDLERSSAPTPQKETGRVEAGSYSNQSFVYDVANYNSWYSSKVTWKILPMSQKPIEVSDLKVFCGMCGAKRKKDTFKFCPQCGAKFE